MVSLSEYLSKGEAGLRDLSKILNSGEDTLDCTDVQALDDKELKALFSRIRPEWMTDEELSNFIEVNTIENELVAQIRKYLIEQERITRRREMLLRILIPLGIVAIPVIGLLVRSYPYITKAKIQAKTITIGTLGSQEYQESVANYLREQVVPANYFNFLRGNEVKVNINGDKALPYQEAQSRIAAKEWDIAFTLSPVNSVFAKDNGYTFAALMFPESQGYQSGLFVKAGSVIKSLDDIKPTTVIGLGSLTSASSFYLPAYDLYGKILTVNIGNRGQKIVEMVKAGQVDIGAAAVGDTVRSDDPDLRIIHFSRRLPGAGVYLSPNLSTSDKEAIKNLMLNAPVEIKKKSNYGIGKEPDYTYLRGLIKKVDNVLICSDFSKNPVNFFCPPGFKPTVIRGKINGASIKSNGYVLKVENSDGSIYQISLAAELLKDVIGSSDLKAIQGKTIEVKTPMKPVRMKDDSFTIKITQPNQIKFLR